MINLDANQVPLADRDEKTWPPCETNPLFRASTTMLSRLAEAVDGHRCGEPAYYVGRYWYTVATEGHRLFGPFKKCRDAEDFRAALPEPGEYGIFGPFYTMKETPKSTGHEVDKVVITFKGTAKKITLSGKEFDAVFWSASSLEKFLIPYYVSIGTVGEGDVLAQVSSDFDVLAHRPGSIWQTEVPQTSIDDVGEPLGIGLYALAPNGKGGAAFTAKLVSGGDDR